jgi:ABC-type phosphate/phosphonate transport system substrate-binding protein
MIPARPEDFFGSVTVFNDDISKIYALAFGTMDAIHVSSVTLEMMKISDPGPAKLVRSISCVGDYYGTPIFASNKMPENVINLLKQQFGYIATHSKEAINDPEYVEYKPLIQKFLPMLRKYKVRIISVTWDNYKSIMDVYNTAKRNGWDKDYELWKKYTKTKAE